MGTPRETQDALVDLWLGSDTNTARIIMMAFKLGVDEGKRICGTGEPDTTLGVLEAFKTILDALPDKRPNDADQQQPPNKPKL